MLIVLFVISFAVNVIVILILFQIVCFGVKKYIAERIKRDLELFKVKAKTKK